jgi:hypothetical protein
MGKSLQDDESFQKRVVEETFKQNPDVKNLDEFRMALFRAFDTPRGNNASKFFDEEDVLTLFERSDVKSWIKSNNPEEYKEMYGEVREGTYAVQRDVSVGKKIKPSQVHIIEKKIVTAGYSRGGRQVRSYNRGYAKWTQAEVRFLRVRKSNKLSPRDIIRQYNEHFKEKARSGSSIKTKIYRSG